MTADRLGTIAERLERFAANTDLLRSDLRKVMQEVAADLRALTPAAGGVDGLGAALVAIAERIEARADAYFGITGRGDVERMGFRSYATELRWLSRDLTAPAPPPADAVRALVGKWDADANGCDELNAHGPATILRACVADLRAALSAAPAGEDRPASMYGLVNVPEATHAAPEPVSDPYKLPAAAPTPEGRDIDHGPGNAYRGGL